jgi:hypothetical protein
MKNKKNLLYLLISIFIYACTSRLGSARVTSSIEDRNSPLIGYFDCKELAVVPMDWDLNAILIQQGTNENGEKYYRCDMNGIRNDMNSSFFSLYYNVIISSNKEIAKTDLKDPTIMNGEEFSPIFVKIGEVNYSLCSKNMEQQTCGLAFRKNNAVIFVRFWTDGGISTSEIENSVNPLLETLSQQLANMQNP